MKTKVETDNAPKAVGLLSQGIINEGLVYTAGQIHTTPDGTLVLGTIEEKTHQVMKNLEAILVAAATDFEHVLKATLYVTDISFGPAVNEVYKTYMTTEPLPVREMVCVKALPLGADIEISMLASL